MWNPQWMAWNLNPVTGYSMSNIQTPNGMLPANVFTQVPKDLFFINSNYYCCVGNNQSNYNTTMAYANANYASAMARFSCCWADPPRYQGGDCGV